MMDEYLDVMNRAIPADTNPAIVETVQASIVALVCIAVLDLLFARHLAARYFALHVAANAVIATFCAKDLYFLATNPMDALRTDKTSMVPLGVVYSIHLYHMIGPGFRLYFVDWLHHILMVCLGCPAMMAGGMVGPLMNFNFFFICGVPGGIDYFLLVLVKQRMIKPLTEKRINRLLNLWCRSPFLVATSTLFFIKTHMDSETQTLSYTVLGFRTFCILLNTWNGMYFMDRVVGNYYVVSNRLHNEYKAAKKLPRNESNAKLQKLVAAANLKDIQKKPLNDDIDDHPLPSVPGAPRTFKFRPMTGLWEAIRSGS